MFKYLLKKQYKLVIVLIVITIIGFINANLINLQNMSSNQEILSPLFEKLLHHFIYFFFFISFVIILACICLVFYLVLDIVILKSSKNIKLLFGLKNDGLLFYVLFLSGIYFIDMLNYATAFIPSSVDIKQATLSMLYFSKYRVLLAIMASIICIAATLFIYECILLVTRTNNKYLSKAGKFRIIFMHLVSKSWIILLPIVFLLPNIPYMSLSNYSLTYIHFIHLPNPVIIFYILLYIASLASFIKIQNSSGI